LELPWTCLGKENQEKEEKRKTWSKMAGGCRTGLEEYGCEIWRTGALDRTEWESVVRAAKDELKRL
jgi:hypothetical protein